MNEKKMLCPFRKDEDGEFAPCYGADCMAYCEYDEPVFPFTSQAENKEPPKHVKTCGMMTWRPISYGACALLSPADKE